VVRDALDGAVLSREELVAVVARARGLAHVADGLRSGWGTLLKPLAWQGDLCFGASRGTRVTFTRPEAASRQWTGVPDPDEAAPLAMRAYFATYGPATVEAFGDWLAGGWFGKRKLRAWFSELGEAVTEVDVGGDRAFVLTEDLDELAATRPTAAVRLLPGFDQYVLGPGTGDARVVPSTHRGDVSKQSGWIAPVVVRGGVVCGTWELDRDRVRVAWFAESGRLPRSALRAEVGRLAGILGRDLAIA
jgi:hypothetical protein